MRLKKLVFYKRLCEESRAQAAAAAGCHGGGSQGCTAFIVSSLLVINVFKIDLFTTSLCLCTVLVNTDHFKFNSVVKFVFFVDLL